MQRPPFPGIWRREELDSFPPTRQTSIKRSPISFQKFAFHIDWEFDLYLTVSSIKRTREKREKSWPLSAGGARLFF